MLRHISEHLKVCQKYSVTLGILILFLTFENVMKHSLSRLIGTLHLKLINNSSILNK